MLKIHQIFIVKFFLLFVSALFITAVISYFSLKSMVIEHNKNNLKNVIEIIEINLDSVKDIDKYVTDIHKKTLLRVTIIDNSGLVLAESNIDKYKMNNHADRDEVIQAKKSKYGEAIRYSLTLNVDFLYFVKKVHMPHKDIYIRLSISLQEVMDEFYMLWQKLIFVFIGIVIISTYISRAMSKRIVYDITQITNYLDEISNKNYKAVVRTKYFYEFLQISLLLKNLVKKLSKNDKKKIKNIAKLRLINKQRNDILSALSHEFKNPIASIIGYAQTIEEDPDMPSKIRNKFLRKISSNGDKISKMLDRLAMSVKLDNGDLELKKSVFDLSKVCKEVATNLQSKYKDRKIVVDVDELVVNSDKTMLELVIINLVDNALKYSSDDVRLTLKDNRLSVQDKGIGIKEDDLEKITSKFFRVNKNSWDNSMGIGLAMVTYVLKLLDSSIEIESEFDRGSTFSFSVLDMLES
ncbi:HAMP domain-containing histidine kinase [Sulfurimonas sp.]|nr:HAMP domain-containing histidine kinase [Sulfurimonas sp.]